MKKLLTSILVCCSITTFGQNVKKDNCSGACCKAPKERTLACKLTSPEIRQRKATIIASLKQQVVNKTEIENGYKYRFLGNDKILDELLEFIKTERLCCGFFDFALNVSGDASEAVLTISGPEGAKEFIKSELEF